MKAFQYDNPAPDGDNIHSLALNTLAPTIDIAAARRLVRLATEAFQRDRSPEAHRAVLTAHGVWHEANKQAGIEPNSLLVKAHVAQFLKRNSTEEA